MKAVCGGALVAGGRSASRLGRSLALPGAGGALLAQSPVGRRVLVLEVVPSSLKGRSETGTVTISPPAAVDSLSGHEGEMGTVTISRGLLTTRNGPAERNGHVYQIMPVSAGTTRASGRLWGRGGRLARRVEAEHDADCHADAQ